MAESVNIGLFFDGSDAAAWADHVAKLNRLDSLRFSKYDLPNCRLENILADSTTVVILLTPSMFELLETQADDFARHFAKHESVAVLTCYTEPKDFSDNLQPLYTKSERWKVLDLGETREQNKKTMAELVAFVDEVIERKTKPKMPNIPRTKRRKCMVVPDLIVKSNQTISISFDQEVQGKVQVGFRDEDQRYDTEKRNPYTFTLKAPYHKPGPTKLQIYENGKKIKSSPLVYSKLMLAAFECPVYLAQVMGVSADDKEKLDQLLAEHFEKSLPDDSLTHDVFKATRFKHEGNRSSVFLPTTLHFAAHNGFTALASLLASSPGACMAFQMENVNGHDPAELAENAGYKELAEYLRLYIETQEEIEACDNIYMEMKHNDESIYSNTSMIGGDRRGSGEYSTTIPQSPPPRPPKPNQNQKRERCRSTPEADTHAPLGSRTSLPTQRAEEFMQMSPNSFSPVLSPGAGGSTTQQKLIDIQQAFKEGHISMADVEHLFETWKSQQQFGPSPSIKERQENLKKLREDHAELLATARSVSKRKKKREKPLPQPMTYTEDPQSMYSTYCLNLDESVRLSNASSGSSSRGSCDSGQYCQADSEDEYETSYRGTAHDEPNMPVRRGSRQSPNVMAHRKTLTLQWMESMENNIMLPVPPKPPPRVPIKASKERRLPSPKRDPKKF